MMQPKPATLEVLTDVGIERERQERLKRTGKFTYNCASPGISDAQRLPILGEEFGEVCKAMLEHPGSSEPLRTELVHLAAVAVGWIEAIDA